MDLQESLGRRNLTPTQKKLLIGDRYEAEKMAHGGDRKSEDVKSTDQFGPLISAHATRARIAAETNSSEGYVQRAGEYSQGAEAAENVSPGFRQEILSGKVKPTQQQMREIVKAPPEKRKPLVKALQTASPKKSNKPKYKVTSKPTMSAESRKSAIAAIQRIFAELARPKPPLTLQGAVQQFEWKVTLMLEDLDGIFNSWPQLVSEEIYRNQVVKTLEDLKEYILHIESGNLYAWDHEARKIVSGSANDSDTMEPPPKTIGIQSQHCINHRKYEKNIPEQRRVVDAWR
ncbi:MAG: hypothetical protein LUE06_07635 [Oscillospiraceae bacterium]|nr:hypothetical protein [Oscillospiraceae bacterium]